MRPRARKLIWIAPLAIFGFAAFVALGGEVVRLLWNWLTPALFGWREITFWQALGVLALCRILFGGFRLAGGGPRSRSRRRMAERWEEMSPEEREKYRERYCRWGFVPPPDAKPNA
jgi:hypothetical protein